MPRRKAGHPVSGRQLLLRNSASKGTLPTFLHTAVNCGKGDDSYVLDASDAAFGGQESADALAIALRANFDGDALVEAVRELSSRTDIVQLPVDAQDAWEEGLRGQKLDPAQASARNVVARAQFLDSTLSARDTAELLGLDQSTVRNYSSSGALHSFVHKGRLRFPRWQFAGSEDLPGLSEVLANLPEGIHPQMVEGFFTSENADLVVGMRRCTPAQWLAEGRDPLPVARQVATLGIII